MAEEMGVPERTIQGLRKRFMTHGIALLKARLKENQINILEQARPAPLNWEKILKSFLNRGIIG